MERAKYSHYQPIAPKEVIPIIFTALGTMSSLAKDLLWQMVSLSSKDVREQSEYRREMYGRLSVLGIKFGCTMALNQARFTMLGYSHGQVT